MHPKKGRKFSFGPFFNSIELPPSSLRTGLVQAIHYPQFGYNCPIPGRHLGPQPSSEVERVDFCLAVAVRGPAVHQHQQAVPDQLHAVLPVFPRLRNVNMITALIARLQLVLLGIYFITYSMFYKEHFWRLCSRNSGGNKGQTNPSNLALETLTELLRSFTL